MEDDVLVTLWRGQAGAPQLLSPRPLVREIRGHPKPREQHEVVQPRCQNQPKINQRQILPTSRRAPSPIEEAEDAEEAVVGKPDSSVSFSSASSVGEMATDEHVVHLWRHPHDIN